GKHGNTPLCFANGEKEYRNTFQGYSAIRQQIDFVAPSDGQVDPFLMFSRLRRSMRTFVDFCRQEESDERWNGLTALFDTLAFLHEKAHVPASVGGDCVSNSPADAFALCVEYAAADDKNKEQHEVELEEIDEGSCVQAHFWCLSPSVAMAPLLREARSLILASGTLSPIEAFRTDLGLPKSHTVLLKNEHVVPPEQVFSAVVPSLLVGATERRVAFTYAEQRKTAWHGAVAQFLLELCRRTPDGVLVFLPSYSLLRTLVSTWRTASDFSGRTTHKWSKKLPKAQANSLWTQLSHVKHVMLEPGVETTRSTPNWQGDPVRLFLRKLRRHIETPSNGRTGALVLAVHRGKLSEGVDFSDRMARAVVCLGLPFPSVKDARVQAMRNFRDRCVRGSGAAWYEREAWRPINQAVGRCLRHQRDHGAVFLVDSRFAVPRTKQQLSSWASRNLRLLPSGAAVEQAGVFFERMRHLPEPSAVSVSKPSVTQTEPSVTQTEPSESKKHVTLSQVARNIAHRKSEQQLRLAQQLQVPVESSLLSGLSLLLFVSFRAVQADEEAHEQGGFVFDSDEELQPKSPPKKQVLIFDPPTPATAINVRANSVVSRN
ncbi:MAG: hypothetical protein MHM6MM_008091, partial [Cercozoa sp. M6MM]